MGAQIAQQAALHGFEVRLHDVSHEQLERALASNRSLLKRRVDRGRLTAGDMTAALDRVRPTRELAEAVTGVDVVIEAIVEQLEPKRQVFAALDRLTPADAILASNSSSLRRSSTVARGPT